MDSWQAIARKLEKKLEDEHGRNTLLDELAAEIQGSGIVAKQDVIGATEHWSHKYSALGYCLFALHLDSGLPLVAHVAHYGGAGTFGPRVLSSLSRFGHTLGVGDVEALCNIVGRYAEGRPGVVPATAFPPFLVPPDYQYQLGTQTMMSGAHRAGDHLYAITCIVERALKRHGWAMAPATTRNQLGETQLTAFLRRIPPLELLRSFMDHVPGAGEAVNEPHSKDGSTPAHLCVRLNLADHLQVLLDLGGADLHVEDHKGRTVLDLAETLMMDAMDTLKRIRARVGPFGPRKKTVAHRNFDFSQVDLERFPEIYLPSAPNGASGTPRTGEVLMSYVKSEVPHLLNTLGPSPPTILPPLPWSRGGGDGDAAICPYPEGSPHARGWIANHRALNAVNSALTELTREDGTPAGLKIVCFPNLRFGKGDQGALPWNDVDLVVMGFDLETGAHAVLLVEVRSIMRARDVIKGDPSLGKVQTRRGTMVLNKLALHIRTLERDLGICASQKWVIPCLALPLCPQTTEGTGAMIRGEPEEADVRLKDKWDTFVERAAVSDNPRMRACAKFRPQLLTRPTLESPDRLKSFFRDALLARITASVSKKMSSDHLDDSDSSDDADSMDDSDSLDNYNSFDNSDGNADEMRRRAMLMLAWLLLHAVGVPVLRNPDFSIYYQSNFDYYSQPWALLTLTQLRALQLAPTSRNSASDTPLLLVGGAGTGKTFVAVEKLLKCEREGLINQGERALFLTHVKNTALVKLVTAQLKTSGAELIQVRCVVPAGMGAGGSGTKELLLTHLRQAFLDGTRFVVLDQLEDFYSNDPADDSLASRRGQYSLLSSLLGLDCFRMFWIIANPFDLPEVHCEELSAYLDNSSGGQNKSDMYGTLVLDKRIRNARGLGVLVDRMEATTSLSSVPMGIVPEPAAGTVLATCASGNPILHDYLQGKKESCFLLAHLLSKLLLRASGRNESILVVRTAQESGIGKDSRQRLSLLLMLEPYLISQFGEEWMAAPLLVTAAWVGDIVDSLQDNDELERVCKYLERALLLPPADKPRKRREADPTPSAHLLQTRFRKLAQEYAKKGRWPRAPGKLQDSVAFQAAMSLVSRLVSISCDDVGNDFLTQQIMQELKETLRNAPQLRHLILCHRCISLLNMGEARGYEADVVIVWDPTGNNKAPYSLDVQNNYVKMLALAKVQAILVAPNKSIALLERRLVGPFGIRLFFPPALGQANGTLKEYMKRELAKLPGMSESLLLVVPPVLDTGRPAYPTGIAELLSEEIVPALQKLHRDCEPHLDIACFHNLRYGCCRDARRSRTISCEGDLSTVIMCFNKTTNAYMVAVFQADPGKGPGQIWVCVPLTNRPDWSSSSGDSGGAGPAHEEPLAVTIQPSISLADCDDDDANDELGHKWEEFLWSARQCQDAREVAADSGLGQATFTWVDLEQLTEGGSGRRKDWLWNFLAAVSDGADASSKIEDTQTHTYPYVYQNVLDWCMMHCTGILVRHISEGIDRRSRAVTAHPALILGTPAAAAVSLPSSEPPRPPPATADDASSGAGNRLLIVGGGGTGKTLLALQKLINCEKESGSINAANQGLFLVHKKNRALMVQVRRLLKKNETRFIRVRAFPSDQGETRNAADLKSFLEGILTDKNIRFVVFDQLEDVMKVPLSNTPQQQQQLLPDPTIIPSIMSMKGFRLLWVTVNPFDAPGPEWHGSLWSYLGDRANSSSILLLGTRVRNTVEIGALLERADAAAVSLPPQLVAEPDCSYREGVGTARAGGAAPTTALLPLWGVPVFAEPFLLGQGGRHRTLAEVLHHLLLYLNVGVEDVLVVDTGEQYSRQRVGPLSLVDDRQTESALVEKFCQPGNRRVPSMAPLLVRAAWVGSIKDFLSDEDLWETKGRLVPVGLSPQDSPFRWLLHFEQCLKEYEHGEGLWSPDDELLNSPALQATMSLVRRFVGWTLKNIVPRPAADGSTPPVREPYVFVKKLAEAVTDASSTHKLRNLILKNRCISLLDSCQVGGAEANVVVFRDSARRFTAGRGHHVNRAFAARLLSRAKIIAVITTEEPETVFGSLDKLYFV